jgi:hypothetical protein
MRHHLRAFRFSIFRREWQAISHLSMQNSRSKQAVGYSKESHLYSDVTAPGPAKISVNAFSPGRFSVQTRCLVRQARLPQTHKRTEGNRSPHPLRMLLSSEAQQRYQSIPYSFDGSHSKFDRLEPKPNRRGPKPSLLRMLSSTSSAKISVSALFL